MTRDVDKARERYRMGMHDGPANEDFSHAEFPRPLGMQDAHATDWPLDAPQKGGRIRTDIPEGAVMANGMKNQTTSAGRFYGRSVIFGKDGDHATPYMTRYWLGRLRLHIFHRGDADPDPHDHPWGFWTFPFTSYIEEVAVTDPHCEICDNPETPCRCALDGVTMAISMRRQIVPAFRWSYRPATHTHRVIGLARMGASYGHLGHSRMADGEWWTATHGKIVTLVWRGKDERKWGFLKKRDGRWCWVAWKDYVFGGGKSAPCE